MIVIYTYNGCSTCRKATQWLVGRGVSFRERPIRETPPGVEELSQMLNYYEGSLKRLFNTSGQDYRRMGLSVTLPHLSQTEALELLAANGNLIKRPFALGKDFGVVGFKLDEWAALDWTHA